MPARSDDQGIDPSVQLSPSLLYTLRPSATLLAWRIAGTTSAGACRHLSRTKAQTRWRPARTFLLESRAIALLAVAGVALVGTFNVIPAALLSGSYRGYNDWAAMQTALAGALSTLWREQASSLPPELARLVDYWLLWHAIKVVICMATVSVFTALGVALWHRYLNATQRAAFWRCGATVATIVVALATAVLVLNVQATAVPLVALLPALPAGGQNHDLAHTANEIRAAASDRSNPYGASPALSLLLRQVERYYWVLASLSAVLALAMASASSLLWRRRGATTVDASRSRSICSTVGVVTALTASVLLVGVAVGVISALRPLDSLVGLLAGV